MTLSQAKAIFIWGTAISAVIFLALSYDSLVQMPKRTQGEKLDAHVVAGKWVWHRPEPAGEPATSPEPPHVAASVASPLPSGKPLEEEEEAMKSAFARAREAGGVDVERF